MTHSIVEREQRVLAAQASGGISADAIYETVLELLDKAGVSGSILDFGAGTGSLARHLCQIERFTRVCAADLIDYSKDLQHPKLSWVFGDLNQELALNDREFDAIIAVEVIEHLENPRFLAREWFRLLKPGGMLIVTTPNNETWRSLISLLLRGKFVAFTDMCYPAHITALVRADLTRIFQEAGFKDVQFAYTNSGSVPIWTHVTWQQISFGRLQGLRYSDNVICAGIKPSQ